MAEFYKVTIFNGNIVSLIQVGDGDRWTHGQAKDIERAARILAPHRTNRLSASHVTLPTVGTNQYVKRYRVSAMAYYAIFVAQGTGIYGPRHAMITIGKKMGPIPGAREVSGGRRGGGDARKARGRKPRFIASSKGQKPNNWLLHAAEITIRL